MHLSSSVFLIVKLYLIFCCIIFCLSFILNQGRCIINHNIILNGNISNNIINQAILYWGFHTQLFICYSFIRFPLHIKSYVVLYYPYCPIFYDALMMMDFVPLYKLIYFRTYFNLPPHCCWKLYFYLPWLIVFSSITLFLYFFLSLHLLSSYIFSFDFYHQYNYPDTCYNEINVLSSWIMDNSLSIIQKTIPAYMN